MAWQNPVTNHNPEDYFTYGDMNRIYGNLKYLYDILSPYYTISTHIGPPELGGENLAASSGDDLITSSGEAIEATGGGVWWIQNDIYTIEDFLFLLPCLQAIADTIGFQFDQEPNTEATAENFNVIESLTYQLYVRALLVLEQYNGNHWVGDPIYTGDGVYLGGIYGST